MSPKALTDGTPGIELKRVDDISLTVAVNAPEKVEKSESGKQYYKLVVIPKNSGEDSVPETIAEATKNPYYVEKTEDSQDIKLTVNTADYGKGQKWSFDVTVTLIQTKDSEVLTKENEGEKAAFISKEGKLSDVSTKEPAYETKLTLKKGTTTVYTTQKDVVAATVVYSQQTSFNQIDSVKDITSLKDGSLPLEAWEEDGKILVTAPAGVKTGKHTLEIVAYGSDTMYKARTTLNINVVQAIEKLSVEVPTTRLYKADKKAVTVKAALSYNMNMAAPKSKKVVWEVVDANGKAFDSWDVLADKITVKNGKVTVDKNLVLSPDMEDNQFRIRAKAADYEGNTVYGLSEIIQLSSTPLEIGEICVMKENADGIYEVVVKQGGEAVTTDKLSDAKIVALSVDAPKADQYTEEEVRKYQIDTTELTYKSSNKAVMIETDGKDAWLKVSKPANNVKLTVTTADGGKKKNILKFSISYTKPAELGIAVYDAEGKALAETDVKEVLFMGTTNSIIKLAIQQKTTKDSAWDSLYASTDYTLKISGGKILTSDTEQGISDVVVTSDKATITLKDKENNETKTYVIKNAAYSNAKAPKVTVNKSITSGSVAGRELLFKVKNGYEYKGKMVMVETDRVDKAGKNNASGQYGIFEASSDELNSLIAINDDGTFKVLFDDSNIPSGKYKLKLTFGKADSDGSFVADAKPVSVTIKASAPKSSKGSFKPVSSYTIQAKAGANVTLTGKGTAVKSYQFEGLVNDNINGQENAFITYFELNNNVLTLRKDLTEEQISYLKSSEGKQNLTGYVTYTALCGDDGYGNASTITDTVKIKIKLK